ncbi:MAG: sialidase family protein [Aggregatilineales bacterium]
MNTVIKPGTGQLHQDFVYALAASRSALYAARASGLYRSQNGGALWQRVEPASGTHEPWSATAVIAHGSQVFAGVSAGVMYSPDDGESWQFVLLSSPPPQVVALALSPTFVEDGFIAAGTSEDGVFISTDHGLHWAAWNFGLIDHAVYALAVSPWFADDRTLFAGTETGLFRSQNGGRGWEELPFPADAAPILSFAASPLFVTDGLLYAGTEKNGLFMSDDFGLNWQQSNGDLISSTVNAIHIRSAAYASPMIWLLLEDKLVSSSDAGHSWKQQRSPFPSGKLAMSMLSLSSSPDRVLVGFADGDILPLW